MYMSERSGKYVALINHYLHSQMWRAWHMWLYTGTDTFTKCCRCDCNWL